MLDGAAAFFSLGSLTRGSDSRCPRSNEISGLVAPHIRPLWCGVAPAMSSARLSRNQMRKP